MIKVKDVLKWTIPMFGNKHSEPYGKLLVGDGETERVVKTKEDSCGSYITFNRKRYRISNKGSLYSPKLEVAEY